jgi:hypothetical protein
MYAPYEEAARSRSLIMKILVRKWDYRYPRVFVGVHFAAATLLLVAANVLFAYHVPAFGAGVLAGAAVHLLVGYRVAATTFLADPGPRASNS